MNKKPLIALILLGLMLGSCASMRKKNRCNTCPTWDSIPGAHEDYRTR